MTDILKLPFLRSAHHDPWGQTPPGHLVGAHHESDMGAWYVTLLPVDETHHDADSLSVLQVCSSCEFHCSGNFSCALFITWRLPSFCITQALLKIVLLCAHVCGELGIPQRLCESDICENTLERLLLVQWQWQERGSGVVCGRRSEWLKWVTWRYTSQADV